MAANDPVLSQVTAVRQRLAPEVRRAQLLDVAERVFCRLGYQGTAMDDIATEAGVTRGLVYNYFRDKDALYLECVRRAREQLELAFTEAALGQQGARAQLEAATLAYFRFVQDRGRSWDILFGGGAAVAGTVAVEVAELRFATAEKIALLILVAVPHLPTEAAAAYAHVVSGAGEQLAKWWRVNPQVPLERVVAYQMGAVWRGLEAVLEDA